MQVKVLIPQLNIDIIIHPKVFFFCMKVIIIQSYITRIIFVKINPINLKLLRDSFLKG